MLNELRGEKRFKTFRANNELYYRIESSSNVDINEQKIYNALLSKLGSSLPSEMYSSKEITRVASTVACGDDGKALMQVKPLDSTPKLGNDSQAFLNTLRNPKK